MVTENSPEMVKRETNRLSNQNKCKAGDSFLVTKDRIDHTEDNFTGGRFQETMCQANLMTKSGSRKQVVQV